MSIAQTVIASVEQSSAAAVERLLDDFVCFAGIDGSASTAVSSGRCACEPARQNVQVVHLPKVQLCYTQRQHVGCFPADRLFLAEASTRAL